MPFHHPPWITELLTYTHHSVQELWVSQWKQVIVDDWVHWLENHNTEGDNLTFCVVPEKVMAFTMSTEEAESGKTLFPLL